jgi:hypothetical protein
MSMPNRSKEVKEICARYPQAFGPPDATVDKRRRLLIPIICRELNTVDGDNWFLLNRLDRNDDDPRPGRLTSDVLVWKPTKEHVDVLSASGGMWGVHPAITDRQWLLDKWSDWPSWDDVSPTPTPVPVPGATHRYNGGGNDTDTCDHCGQPRAAVVHAVPEAKLPHAYDGGEQDTGACDICGLPRDASLHAAEPDKPAPVPHEGTVDQKLDGLKDQLDAIRSRQDRPLFPVPEDTDGSQ